MPSSARGDTPSLLWTSPDQCAGRLVMKILNPVLVFHSSGTLVNIKYPFPVHRPTYRRRPFTSPLDHVHQIGRPLSTLHTSHSALVLDSSGPKYPVPCYPAERAKGQALALVTVARQTGGHVGKSSQPTTSLVPFARLFGPATSRSWCIYRRTEVLKLVTIIAV